MQEKPSAYKVRHLDPHSQRNQERKVEIIPTFTLPQNIVNFLPHGLFHTVFFIWTLGRQKEGNVGKADRQETGKRNVDRSNRQTAEPAVVLFDP